MAASSGFGTLLYPKLVSLCIREEFCVGFSVACVLDTEVQLVDSHTVRAVGVNVECFGHSPL